MEGHLIERVRQLALLLGSEQAPGCRRQLLGQLIATVAMSGLGVLWPGSPLQAKKKHKKHKKHRRKKKKNRPCPAQYSPDSEESLLVNLINGYRGAQGRPGLALQGQLGAAAKSHSVTLAVPNSGLIHNSDLAAFLKSFCYAGFTLAGENLARGQQTAPQVLAGWQASPTHNANLLNATFNQIGIGRAFSSGCNCWYWTAEFGAQ